MLLFLVQPNLVDALPKSSSLYGDAMHLKEATKENSLSGVHLTIVTTEDPPFIAVRDPIDGTITEWQKWSGWIPAMIAAVAEEAGFTYSLQLNSGTNTKSYGQSDKDLQSGVFREEANKDTFNEKDQGGFGSGPANINWAGAYITTSRLEASKETAPFYTAPLSLLIRAQSKCSGSSNFSFKLILYFFVKTQNQARKLLWTTRLIF